MPASLLSAKIRGVRSYSPYEHKAQTIEFMPLTLIVGSNGSGKTTVIESLKFIISGEEPPLSDCRRNFLHTTKKPTASFDKNTSYASIELQFQNSNNEICIARREILRVSIGKNTTPSISSGYKIDKKPWINVHKQDDWNKTIPRLFNLPNQAILNNVVLCHQEENLWCMGDSSTVKQIFDKIFGCEQYKKEIKYMDAEKKACKTDLALSTKDLVHGKEKVEVLKKLKIDFANLKADIDNVSVDISALDSKIRDLNSAKELVLNEIQVIETKLKEIEYLKQKASGITERSETLQRSLYEAFIDPNIVSDSELNQRKDNHAEMVNQKRRRQAQMRAQEELLKRDVSNLERQKATLQDVINKLKVVELKSHETHESLENKLKTIKSEQNLEQIDIKDMDRSLKILENFEKLLLQNKCEQAELEDRLSSKQQKLAKKISNLEGTHQGLIHKVKNKEVFVNKLSGQLAQADPLAKDLVLVLSNLGKMSSITSGIPDSGLVTNLIYLIEESSNILSRLVKKIQDDSIVKLTAEIDSESIEIENSKSQLKSIKDQQKECFNQQDKIETEYVKIKALSKEAHKKVVLFQSSRDEIVAAYEKCLSDRKIIESNNIVEKCNELEDSSSKIDLKRAELNSLAVEHSRLADEIGESFTTQEEFKNNIAIRDFLKQLDAINEKMSSLEASIENTNNLHKLRLKLNEIEQQELKQRDKRSMIIGSKIQMDKALLRMKEDLRGHAKTNSKYAESLGKVVCNKIIISDLEKLKECFRESIITFHDQMILKINQVLRLKWRQVYKGSDIDHIELVDEEVTKGNDKKVSNYYIAMRKEGIMMKMREKSSAGQKALASIILRMTLAELFVKDFAFIALDEPTANLDLVNVQSLAKAIGSYVKRRTKNGVNIQWIIITHDEEFLRALDSECSPYYYRVQLDHEGCSKIVKISYQPSPSSSVHSSRGGTQRK